jgi:hypothetical protein
MSSRLLEPGYVENSAEPVLLPVKGILPAMLCLQVPTQPQSASLGNRHRMHSNIDHLQLRTPPKQ